MGTDTLTTAIDGTIVASDNHNSIKGALTVDLYPRNSSGVVTDQAGDLGSSTYEWKALYTNDLEVSGSLTGGLDITGGLTVTGDTSISTGNLTVTDGTAIQNPIAATSGADLTNGRWLKDSASVSVGTSSIVYYDFNINNAAGMVSFSAHMYAVTSTVYGTYGASFSTAGPGMSNINLYTGGNVIMSAIGYLPAGANTLRVFVSNGSGSLTALLDVYAYQTIKA